MVYHQDVKKERNAFMKRFILLLLALSLLLLCACTAEDEKDASSGSVSSQADIAKDMDIEAEASAIIEKYQLTTGTRFSSLSQTAGEYLDEDLILGYYGEADFSAVEAYAVYIDETKPTKRVEFGIFKMKDGADGELLKAYLKARVDAKIEEAKSYPSVDTEGLKTAEFTVMGKYVWYSVVKGGNEDINNTLKGKLS